MKVALLRGINVGGNTLIRMSDLKQIFEHLGAYDVRTLLNTGNIVYKETHPISYQEIRTAIFDTLGLDVDGVIFSHDQIHDLVINLPEDWVTDATVKTDVMFYISSPETLPPSKDFVKTLETPIALVWHVTRENASRSGANKLIGTPFYKSITIRNANTVRKIYALMSLPL